MQEKNEIWLVEVYLHEENYFPPAFAAGNKVEMSCLNSYMTSFIFNCHKGK